MKGDPGLAKWIDPDTSKSVLMSVIEKGGRSNSRVVNILLRYGADVNYVEPNRKETALMMAAKVSKVDICESLMQAGADPLLKNRQKKNAADLATDAAIKRIFSQAASSPQGGRNDKVVGKGVTPNPIRSRERGGAARKQNATSFSGEDSVTSSNEEQRKYNPTSGRGGRSQGRSFDASTINPADRSVSTLADTFTCTNITQVRIYFNCDLCEVFNSSTKFNKCALTDFFYFRIFKMMR